MVEERIIDGYVGPQKKSDGVITPIRTGMTGELVTGNAHGFYTEIASRGGIYMASTSTSGVAPGTALNTTPPFALWNPPGSGVMINILRISIGYISGTLGAGSIMYAYVPGQVAAPTSGTKLSPTNNKIGTNANCMAGAYQGSTMVATPTLLKPAFITGAFAGGANNIGSMIDPIDGMISIPPGYAFVVQGVAGAGTSPLVQIAAEWEETPIPTAPA